MKATNLLAGAALVLFPTLAHAGLLGSTVDVTARYPDASSIYTDPGAVVVTGGIEYPAGSYPSYNPSWQVQVTDNQILITDTTSSGLPFLSAPFNGFVLDVLSGPPIASGVTDGSSTIVPVGVYVSGGELYINFAGVDQVSGGAAVVDFTTGSSGVPETGTWAMMLFGFAGIGFAGYNKAKNARAPVAA